MKKSAAIVLSIVLSVMTLNISTAQACDSAQASNKESQMKSSMQHASQKLDIVDTAISAGAFNTLVAAVKAAGLVDILKGEGPFTVFAPTDEAFAKLPEGTVEDLLKEENLATLQSILTYHVVAGKVMAADVVNLKSAKTVEGTSIDIVVNDNGVMVDGATVLKTDIETSNGVIHVIDTVILPKKKSSSR